MDAADALDLISQHGRALTLRQFAAGNYNPSTGITTPGATTDTSVVAAQRGYSERAVDGITIKSGDQKVIIASAGLTVVPEVGNHIVEGSEAKVVVGVRTFRSRGTVIAWDLHVRAIA